MRDSFALLFARRHLSRYLSTHHKTLYIMAAMQSGSVNTIGDASAVTPSAISTHGNENTSIMQQVATQERQINELKQMLQERNQRLDKFQTAKKAEMEAMLSGMRDWIKNLELKNENYRADFEKGLQRLVDNSADDNGVWQVMCEASSAATKKEEQYQTLKQQYDELKQKTHGGEFGGADARVGDKRQALDAPDTSAAVNGDIWSQFIADVSVTGYN
jgi:chromosome segregation ATPase